MTFIEAAKAVLDQEGRPMRSREIAEKAVALGLLSHVGKTPVQTMSARISATVAKEGSPFVRVRPGVFGLTAWKGSPPGPKKTAAPPGKELPPKPTEPAPQTASKIPLDKDSSVPQKEGSGVADRSPSLHVNEESDSSDGNAAVSRARTGETPPSKRRKRKKRKTSNTPAPSTTSEMEPDLQKRAQSHREETPSTSGAPPMSIKPPTLPHPVASQPHTAPPAPSAPSSPPAPPPAPPAPSQSSYASGSLKQETRLTDLVNQVETILRRNSRPIPREKILDAIGLKGEGGPALLEALMASDALERERRGQRPRFVKYKSGYGLLEREVSTEIIALENQGAELRTRLIQIAEKQLIRKLRSMPMGSFIRVMIMYLQRSGFGAMVPVNFHRNGEFHLSVQDRRHQGRFCTGVVLRKDAADFELRERAVMDLRGALHHYDAMNGMIFTTGQVSDKAIMEGRIPNLPPVVLVDGETLTREMVQMGIGVKMRTLTLPAFDETFFSNLEM